MFKHIREWLTVLLALSVFAGLGGLPWISKSTATPPWVKLAASEALQNPPQAAAPVPLAALKLAGVAQGAKAGNPMPLPSEAAGKRLAAQVLVEDNRLRALEQHWTRIITPTVQTIVSYRCGKYRNLVCRRTRVRSNPNRYGNDQPEFIKVAGSLPTLVLPPHPGGFSFSELVATGAARAIKGEAGSYLLIDNVFVLPGASLSINKAQVTLLLMNSSKAGVTSLVTWGGTLSLSGESPAGPLKIQGWNQSANQIATDPELARPYIRALGGRLSITNAQISDLGFWSGRTGGVAWTGTKRGAASGGATHTVFSNDTYGAFVAHGSQINFGDDLFESNQIDGLRLHHGADNSSVNGCAAASNGGNGFVVSRGAIGDKLIGDLALGNGGNGFLLNGQALSAGISPAGEATAVTTGTEVRGGEAWNNLDVGIVVEGGAAGQISSNIICGVKGGIVVRAGASQTLVSHNEISCGGRTAVAIESGSSGTSVLGNDICSKGTGMAVQAGVTGTVVANNDVRCGGNIALNIGEAPSGAAGSKSQVSVVAAGTSSGVPPGAGTTVQANNLESTQIGVLIQNSAGVAMNNNTLAGMSLFGVLARGASFGIVGRGNRISGLGLKAVTAETGAKMPVLGGTDLRWWVHRSDLSALSYLRFHPILMIWLVVAGLVFLLWILSRTRRRVGQLPYKHHLQWQGGGVGIGEGAGLAEAGVGGTPVLGTNPGVERGLGYTSEPAAARRRLDQIEPIVVRRAGGDEPDAAGIGPKGRWRRKRNATA